MTAKRKVRVSVTPQMARKLKAECAYGEILAFLKNERRKLDKKIKRYKVRAALK